MPHSAENESSPIFAEYIRLVPKTFGSQSESSITSAESNTLQLRQPIRIEYYVTRLVIQSESSNTSPESSLGHPRALGSGGGPFLVLGSSRLALAYLNTWGPPPHLPDQLKLLLLRGSNQHHPRIETNLWFNKQSTEWCLRTSIETTQTRKAAPLNDGCKLQKRWLCHHDWRWYRSEKSIKAGNVRPCRVRIKIFLPSRT